MSVASDTTIGRSSRSRYLSGIIFMSNQPPYFHPAWFEPLSREMPEGAIAPYFSSCKPEFLL
jgi:hypothetical protein